jgi:hypothetical protein
MTERTVEVPETRNEQIAAFKAWSDQFPVEQEGDWLGDALMREYAKTCRGYLADVGLEDTGRGAADRQALAAVGAGEGGAAWIGAHWLAEFHTYRACRERIEAGDRSDRVLTSLGWAMHEMGRLQEELRWRPTKDPITGKARERLMLQARDMQGRNSGRQAKTNDRAAFLREIAARLETTKQAAIARNAVAEHSRHVRRLWNAEGAEAETKILAFLRNHRRLVFER